MKSACALLSLLLFASLAFAAPDREPTAERSAPGPPASQWPDLSGETDYGTITQNGRFLELAGDEWVAHGQILDDGRILFSWHSLEAGAWHKIGIYRIDAAGDLRGKWAWTFNLRLNRPWLDSLIDKECCADGALNRRPSCKRDCCP